MIVQENTQAEGEEAATEAADAGWFSAESSTFGDRLAGAREAAGLSQADLARRLGVKEKTLRGWEEDLSEPRANKLQMLSGILNVSITWLLAAEGQGLDRPAGEEKIASDGAQILTEMRQLAAEIDRASQRMKVLEKRVRGHLRKTG